MEHNGNRIRIADALAAANTLMNKGVDMAYTDPKRIDEILDKMRKVDSRCKDITYDCKECVLCPLCDLRGDPVMDIINALELFKVVVSDV